MRLVISSCRANRSLVLQSNRSQISDLRHFSEQAAGEGFDQRQPIAERTVIQRVAQDADHAGRGFKISRHLVPDPLLECHQQIVRERQSTGAVRPVGIESLNAQQRAAAPTPLVERVHADIHHKIAGDHRVLQSKSGNHAAEEPCADPAGEAPGSNSDEQFTRRWPYLRARRDGCRRAAPSDNLDSPLRGFPG